MSNPIYPRGFVTPAGRPVSIATMARALRAIRANPGADYPGWDWFEVQGYAILRAFHDGLNDRINRRGEAVRNQ